MATRTAAEMAKLKEQLDEALKTVAKLEKEKAALVEDREKLAAENIRLWNENAAMKNAADVGLVGKIDALMELAKDTHLNTKVLVDVHGPTASTYAAAVKGSGLTSAKPRPPLIIPNATPRRAAQEDPAKHAVGLVVMGLAEEGDDLVHAQQLVNELKEGVEVKRAFRMPAIPRDDGRPRLLKIIVDTPEQATSILRNAFNLKDNEEFENVFIRRSMPLSERVALRNLKIRARQLTEESQEGFIYYVLPNTFKMCRKRNNIQDYSFTYQGN